mmetsp:Transcript_5545/g.7006  ORF Transcript_5545/g.7006 Transcript_5545/m.7006 type:complete len:91 (+) Transcript_5545:204-476(+)
MDAKIWRIDADNTNPRRVWEEMGSPNYLKPEMVNKLKESSKLIGKPAKIDAFSNSSGCFLQGKIRVPPFGLAVLEINLLTSRPSGASFPI